MNDPNKAINVNLSSLLSLKAELLRKQHEVKLAKATKGASSEFKPKEVSKQKSKKQDHDEYKKVSCSDEATVYESEDYAQLAKSRQVLEAKSKFYEKMSRSGGSLNTDDNCLVMFNRKKQEEEVIQPFSPQLRERLSSSSSDNSEDDEDDEEEVEYVDCLGRTRKCLRKELKEAKSRDKQLADSMPERLDQTKANWLINVPMKVSQDNSDSEDNEASFQPPAPPQSVLSEALSTMTKHDEQRINWERKEQENFDKPDVHYQDVFFDEARTHGVGYYAFSTDEKERREQQRDLEKARQTTSEEQKRREEMRAKRDSIVADRVLAAKNRIRARNGLPPISKEEVAKETEMSNKKEERKKEKHAKQQKEQDQKREEEEAERERIRKDYVRDWDKDKKGLMEQRKPTNDDQDEEVPWEYKAERLPMSQEQWNEKQRALRPKEFAPPKEIDSSAPPKRTNFTSEPLPLRTLYNRCEPEFSNFHSTKQEKHMQRRNYLAATAEEEKYDEVSTSAQWGAAIPPPSDLDLEPSSSKRHKTENDLERSIEAGLRFLRNNCDKNALSNKATWTAKADY
ncbi:coiled-coil domain-containing protein 174 [Drosophila tropicalis]|uniref:coiled-coil domain-containing protein 174 n=1 Tax=Drosophila tropicalis TaxID=46794 RepID=UPI0035ABFE55